MLQALGKTLRPFDLLHDRAKEMWHFAVQDWCCILPWGPMCCCMRNGVDFCAGTSSLHKVHVIGLGQP